MIMVIDLIIVIFEATVPGLNKVCNDSELNNLSIQIRNAIQRKRS